MKPATAALLGLLCIAVPRAGADLTIADLDGTAIDEWHVYQEGATTDTIRFPLHPTPEFWRISIVAPNQFRFETLVNVGQSSARISFSGLEAHDDWASANISSTGGLPSLTYGGGDQAVVAFDNLQLYRQGDLITVTFTAIPEPAPAGVLSLAALWFAARRRGRGARSPRWSPLPRNRERRD